MVVEPVHVLRITGSVLTLIVDSSCRRKIESWRLAQPSGVHLYVNDCMITSAMSICQSLAGEGDNTYGTAPEDEYLEWYVCTLVNQSEYRWDMSSGYGAPGAPVRNHILSRHRLAS
jgi:hypothetical protein